MTHVTCNLTAENRDQLRNRTVGNRVWATFTFAFTHFSGPQAGNEMGVFFGKKVGNGECFVKKLTFPQRRVHYVQY